MHIQVADAEKAAKTAAEYEQLVKSSKEQFRKELQIVLPNYLQGDKGNYFNFFVLIFFFFVFPLF